jgi:hypothetical protein
MDAIGEHFSTHGLFQRRRDLLAAGFTDRHIKAALARGHLFRVRHGWYARPDTPEAAVRAVRVGGRLTGVSALRLRGLFLPKPVRTQILVPANAARLRNPRVRFEPLSPLDGVQPLWSGDQRSRLDPASWIVTDDDALGWVLRHERREIAVAACDGVLRYLGFSAARLAAAFAHAPARVWPWLELVDGRADAWGETYLRLRLRDAGLTLVPQPAVPGIGRLDGRVSDRVYIEVDGAQHAEDWDGDVASVFENDHWRDAAMAARGDRVLRFTNRQLVEAWPLCLAAIRRACIDDRRPRDRLRAVPEPLPPRARVLT